MALKINPKIPHFIPLGGCGQFGNNLSVLAYGGQYLIMDFGSSFAEDHHPGVDILLPKLSFLVEERKKIQGIVITHGHLDHIGALPYLWPQLECPIYAPPLSADMIRGAFAERGLERLVKIYDIEAPTPLTLGKFIVDPIKTAHSVPDSLMFKVQMGPHTILNTGDWKLDTTPLVGHETDVEVLKKIGQDGGVDALFADSTNVIKSGSTPSFKKFETSFDQLLAEQKKTIFVVCQGVSALYRLKVLIDLAPKYGRKIALLGRSIMRSYQIAVKHGLIEDSDYLVSAEEMMQMLSKKRLFVCTGSQAEPRAAMTRIARHDYHHVTVNSGDAVVFSARIIPGNEQAIATMKTALSRQGANIISNDDIPHIYISGHAHADETRQLIEWVKPKTVIPVHGDYDHQEALCSLAKDNGIAASVIPENGQIIALQSKGNQIVGATETGLWALDGERLIDSEESNALKERRKLAWNGTIMVIITIDEEGYLFQDPQMTVMGLCDTSEDEDVVTRGLSQAIESAINDLDKGDVMNDKQLHEAVRLAVRRSIREDFGKKPVLAIHIVRLS